MIKQLVNNAWNVKEDHFKTKKNMEEKLKFFLEYAILAPSGYNCQPWKFKIDKNRVKVWNDLSKTRQVIDPENRESHVSAGTAITNLVLAAKNFGFDSQIEVNKENKGDADLSLSAIITFREGTKGLGKKDKPLFEAITKRQTNREAYSPKQKIEKQKIDIIKGYKAENGISLKVFDEENIKKKLGAIVADAGLFWYQRKDFREELISWLSGGSESEGDRIWQKFYGGKGNSDVMTMAEEKAIRDEILVNQAPIIMIIESRFDKKADWIWTGVELEKILLKLTAMDIQHTYFNTVVQSDRHRNKLKSELGNGFTPQLFLRLGKTKKVKRSPRREIRDFLVWE